VCYYILYNLGGGKMEQHYTVKQVSEKLNLSLSTLRNYIRDGVIQVKQIPGTKTIRIAESEIKKILEVK
jgi:excisionase family DNA binding protein